MNGTHAEEKAIQEYEALLAEYEELAHDFYAACQERDEYRERVRQLEEFSNELENKLVDKVDVYSRLVSDLDHCRREKQCVNCGYFYNKDGCYMDLNNRVEAYGYKEEEYGY